MLLLVPVLLSRVSVDVILDSLDCYQVTIKISVNSSNNLSCCGIHFSKLAGACSIKFQSCSFLLAKSIFTTMFFTFDLLFCPFS